MERQIILRDADQHTVVSFSCFSNECDHCPFRFKCYTTIEPIELSLLDIDEKLWRMPRSVFVKLIGLSDDEFYLKAFKIVREMSL